MENSTGRKWNALGWFFLIFDICSCFICLGSLLKFCDRPLRLWLFVNSILGIPATSLVSYLAKHRGVEFAIRLEIALTFVSILWLGVGTYWTNESLYCPSTAPILWYYCFLVSTLSWCSVTGLIFLVITETIVQEIFSSKRRAASRVDQHN
eukprot:GHVP01065878.1.p1 GENE.GHVP01065878.1~~GHVP01065878.1.p1  ORF type:complete len:151 (-),score=9.91 GHVP01065878.1:149-601(-)